MASRVGLFGVPRRWAAAWLEGLRALAGWLAPWPRWVGLSVLFGAGPVLLDFALQTRMNHAVTALFASPLLLAAVARDRTHPALSCVVLTYLLHSATMIVLAANAPERLAVVFPPGEQYWQETAHWLRTGEVGVYDVGNWVPFHLQLAAAMVLLTFVSLGFFPLWHGLHELDLMNFYVGQYLAHIQGPFPGMVLSWHPWSLCRGVGFFFLVYELTSLALSALTGERLSPMRWRLWRLGLGIGFLLLDGVVKWTFTEPVRQVLSAGLRP